jgi:hypothetical protein
MDSVSKEVSAWAIMQFYTERSVERSLMYLCYTHSIHARAVRLIL